MSSGLLGAQELSSEWLFSAAGNGATLNAVTTAEGAGNWRIPRWNVNIPATQTVAGQGLHIRNDGAGGSGRRTAFVDLSTPLQSGTYTLSMRLLIPAATALPEEPGMPRLSLSWIAGDSQEVATIEWVADEVPISGISTHLLVVNLDAGTWQTGVESGGGLIAASKSGTLPEGADRMDSIRLRLEGNFNSLPVAGIPILQSIALVSGAPDLLVPSAQLPKLRISNGAQGVMLHIAVDDEREPADFALQTSSDLVQWAIVPLQSGWQQTSGDWLIPVAEVADGTRYFFRLTTPPSP
ncbi:MAG: hypothetical protein LR015_04725 [Verrucomicrobia bacterium]|nr:hypothetical protein [Verrucomicrobiota bacterium]